MLKYGFELQKGSVMYDVLYTVHIEITTNPPFGGKYSFIVSNL